MAEPSGPAERAQVPLLTRISQESLDESYEQTARQRAGRPPPTGRRPRWVGAAVVAVFGLLVTVAAVQTSESSGIASANRDSLLSEIDQRTEDATERQARIVELRAANVGLQDDLDKSTEAARKATERTTALAARTGFAPVHGPGVVVTVDDAPNGESVRSDDLALLVNGLWEAGAEAISINGKRLTARSALYNSGPAINVNGPPSLSPPYTVAAIGDNRSLRADLLNSTTGLQFTNVADALGFPVSMENVGDITLPAAPERQLRLRSAVEGKAE